MKRFTLLLASVILLTVSPKSRAADWYLHADQPGSDNWNTVTDWWSTPDAGTHPASINGADRFFSNGCLVRTPSTTSASTFGGASLTLNGSAIYIKSLSTTLATTIGNLISYGGSITNATGNIQIVDVTNFAIHQNTTINSGGATRGLDLAVGTLTGNGDLTLTGDGTLLLTINAASSYTGTMYASGTTSITFENALVSRGSLVVPSGVHVTLNANVTFSDVTVNGTTRSPGTYSAASLGFSGTGSLIVSASTPWYLHADEAIGTSWDTLSNWWSTPTGGSNPGAISSNDDFYTNGRLLRTPGGTSGSTFGGAFLTMNGGSVLLKNVSTTTATTIGNFISEGTGGSISQGTGGTLILNITNLWADSATKFDTVANNRNFSLSAVTLSGTGDITLLGHGGGQLLVNIANANNYTGTLSMSASSTGTLTFQNSLFSAGSFVVGAGNSVVVNNPVSFAGLTVGGVAKAAGTYSAASLGFSGTGTVTVTNRPPQMFGVNEAGMEFSSGTFVPKDASLAYYETKGLTLIRVPFKWERIQPTLNGALDSTQLASLDTVLANANARGMKVILDLHNYGAYNGNQIGSAGTPYSAYQDVWNKLATHFAASPDADAIYAYDIMNEPNAASLDWPTAAQYAINGIRAADSTHFIMVEGKSFSSATAWPKVNAGLINLTDSQKKLMFSAHCYFANSNNDQYGSYDSEGAYPNKGVDKVAPFVEWCKIHKVYGHIGEYGVPANDARWNVVLQNFLQYLADNDISGTYWAGGAWSTSYSLSCEPTSSYTVDRPQMSVLEQYHQ